MARGWDALLAIAASPPPSQGGGGRADAGYIREGLIRRGLPEHVADGFVMNMIDESGLRPDVNEAAPIVPGSRGGYGLYQLTGPRRRAYEAFAAQRGVSTGDVDAQLDFLVSELQGPESRAWSRIQNTRTAGEAGAAIVNDFLRPAEQHRVARARKYLGSGYVPPSASPGIAAEPAPSYNRLWLDLGGLNG